MILKNLFLNNITLKTISLIIGYGIWSLLGQNCVLYKQIEIPICFYNTQNHIIACHPEHITISIAGKRKDLKNCHDLGLHINAHQFTSGTHYIMPTDEQLFLPSSIKLVSYKPHKIMIEIQNS